MRKAVPVIFLMLFISSAAAGSAAAETDMRHAYDPISNMRQAEKERMLPYEKGTVVFKKKTGDINLFSENDELYELGLTDIEKLSLSENSFRLYSDETETVYKAHTSGDVWETVDALNGLEDIVYAEPDYLYYPQVYSAGYAAEESVDHNAAEQWYIENMQLPAAWEHIAEECGQTGGSPDTVIAVIDTGVDYTHPDLKDAMWVNENEIPGNGIDDDGNGYVDDVYGCSTVSDERFHSGDPMDDHGHGTHVAGIIGMQPDNGIGGVGAAYGCRIMAVKAGQSTGVFSSTDIAEAIDYAYTMGADVINMSFGSYAESSVVRDALGSAFSSSVLVASAGNDGTPNLPSEDGRNMYPAAYDWVIGVMAHDMDDSLADFSNYEYMRRTGGEYEISAPGCEIYSTLPGNRYAKWSGTSMAAPMVSSAAALMRAKYSDKSSYSTRFIISQLISTAEDMITSMHGTQPKLDAYRAMTAAAKPDVSYKEHHIFDSVVINAENDGDGTADAGETIDLGITVKNHWGSASNVQVKLDAVSEGGLKDPYVTFENDTVDYGSIGVFNDADNGIIRNDGEITGVTEPFRIKIASDTPNDTVIKLNVTVTASNGDDEADTEVYESKGQISFSVQNGREIGGYLNEDITLTKDRYWIISSSLMIPEGITVDIEPGTQVQFYSAGDNDVYIQSDGTLDITGTEEEPVQLFLGSGYENKSVKITGNAVISYAEIVNPEIDVTSIDHVNAYGNAEDKALCFKAGTVRRSRVSTKVNYSQYLDIGSKDPDTYDCVLFDNCTAEYSGTTAYRNCTFLINRSSFSNDNVSWRTSEFENLGFWVYTNRKQVYSDIRLQDGKKVVASGFCNGGYPIEDPYWHNDELARAMKSRYGDDWKEDLKRYIAESKGATAVETDWDHAMLIQWFGEDADEVYDIRSSGFLMEFDESVPDEEILRPADFKGFYLGFTENNAFLNRLTDPDTSKWMKIVTTEDYNRTYHLENNYWGTVSEELIEKQITDQEDSVKLAKIEYEPYLTVPSEETYPFVADVSVFDSGGNKTGRIGMEVMTVQVTFNRDMDTEVQPEVYFGPAEPYTDFSVRGDWISPRVWEGTYAVKPSIGDGIQYFRVSGAAAADDAWLVTGEDTARFMFEIVTTGAESMQLQANGVADAVELEWSQDDQDTVAGYNLYRSGSTDGEYERINTSIIAPDVRSYTDTDVEAGKTYYYRFTIVQTDLTESGFSQTAEATVYDNIAPVIDHTPETETAAGAAKSIGAEITDNIGVEYVLLSYRSAGSDRWKTLSMSSLNGDTYIAVIPASDTMEAFEYYIEASDGNSIVYSGSAEEPYRVAVTETPVIYNITPAESDINGGGVFILTGVNFKEGAAVYIGGKEAENVTVKSAGEISGTLPANNEGAYDIRIVNPDGGEYTAAKGITYKNMTGSIVLENARGKRGSLVSVPVRAEGITSMSSAELTLSFDEDRLEFIDIQKGITTEGFNVECESADGKITIRMTGGELTGDALLCSINFRIKEDVIFVFANVTCESAYINGAAAGTGSAYVDFENAYTVSGNVRYYSDDSAVEGVSVAFGSSEFKTDASGHYETGLLNDDTYRISVSKRGDQRNITAYDAALALRYSVGIEEFSDAQKLAADVNGDGEVNAVDASLILQTAAGKLNGDFPGSGKQWEFMPNNYDHRVAWYETIDIDAVELGDTSGNWGSAEALAGGGDEAAVYNAPAGSRVLRIPVALDTTSASGDIIGIDIGIDISDSMIRSAEFKAAEAAEGCMIEQSEKDGMLRLAVMSASAMDITADPLLILELELNEPLEDELALDISYIKLNEVSAAKDLELKIKTLEAAKPDTPPVQGELLEVTAPYIESDIDMSEAAMYAAGYSADGRLLYVFRAEGGNGLFSISEKVPETADHIKVFLWDERNMRPFM